MKKVFTLFVMALLAIGAFATESVYKTALFGSNYNSAGISAYTKTWSATNNGFTVNLAYFNNNNNGWTYIKGGNKTSASVATITTAAPVDSAVTKVAVTVTAATTASINSTTLTVASDSNFTADVQTVTVAAATGTLEYVVPNPTKNCYYKLSYDCQKGSGNGLITISKVEYYANINAPEAPTFDKAAGTYYDGVTVKMTAPKGIIYYTIDGNDPTQNSYVYDTTGVVLNTTTTLKAVAYRNDSLSAVTSAVYTIVPTTAVANIAEYIAADSAAVVKFTNPVTVTACSGKNLYVKDETGYAYFYGTTGQTYNTGNVIPAGFMGTRTNYNGEPELSIISGFEASTASVNVAPETITASQVGSDMFAHYVVIEKANASWAAKTITDATGSAPCYGNLGGISATAKDTVNVKAFGIVGSYGKTNTVYEFFPTALTNYVYSVAGSNADVFGAAWDAENTATEMTSTDTCKTYTWTNAQVKLAAGTIEYKVVVDHNWSTCYPKDFNATLTIPEDGTYELVFKYTVDGDYVSATATKKGTTGVNDLNVNSNAVRKVIENGRLLIIAGDKKFDVLGAEVK